MSLFKDLELLLYMHGQGFSHTYQLLKMIFRIYFLCHVIACFYFVLAKFQIVYLEETQSWIQVDQLQDADFYTQYVQSLYVATAGVMLIGTKQYTNIEYTVSTFTLYGTVGIFSYIISKVSMILEDMERKKVEYNQNLKIISNHMKEKHLNVEIQAKVRAAFEEMEMNKEKLTINTKTQQLFEQMPANISTEIQSRIYANIIDNHLLFFKDYFSRQTIQQLPQIMKENQFFTNQTIFGPGMKNQDQCLNLVFKGSVDLFYQNDTFLPVFNSKCSYYKNCIKKCKFGDIIGLENFITGQNTITQAISQKFSIVFQINRNDFLDIIKNNKKDMETFQMLKDRLNESKSHSVLLQRQLKCDLCSSKFHQMKYCDVIKHVPQTIKLSYIYSRDFNKEVLERTIYYRNPKRTHNSFLIKECLDILKSIFQRENQEIIEEYDMTYLRVQINISTWFDEDSFSYTDSDEEENSSQQSSDECDNRSQSIVIAKNRKQSISTNKMLTSNQSRKQSISINGNNKSKNNLNIANNNNTSQNNINQNMNKSNQSNYNNNSNSNKNESQSLNNLLENMEQNISQNLIQEEKKSPVCKSEMSIRNKNRILTNIIEEDIIIQSQEYKLKSPFQKFKINILQHLLQSIQYNSRDILNIKKFLVDEDITSIYLRQKSQSEQQISQSLQNLPQSPTQRQKSRTQSKKFSQFGSKFNQMNADSDEASRLRQKQKLLTFQTPNLNAGSQNNSNQEQQYLVNQQSSPQIPSVNQILSMVFKDVKSKLKECLGHQTQQQQQQQQQQQSQGILQMQEKRNSMEQSKQEIPKQTQFQDLNQITFQEPQNKQYFTAGTQKMNKTYNSMTTAGILANKDNLYESMCNYTYYKPYYNCNKVIMKYSRWQKRQNYQNNLSQKKNTKALKESSNNLKNQQQSRVLKIFEKSNN